MQVNNDSIRVHSRSDGSSRPPAIPSLAATAPSGRVIGNGTKCAGTSVTSSEGDEAAATKKVGGASVTGTKRKSGDGASGDADAEKSREFKRIRATEFW